MFFIVSLMGHIKMSHGGLNLISFVDDVDCVFIGCISLIKFPLKHFYILKFWSLCLQMLFIVSSRDSGVYTRELEAVQLTIDLFTV